MKKLNILLLAFIISLQTFSQMDLNYSGPAKLIVNSYHQQLKYANESVDKGQFNTVASKTSTLERLIANIKKKDPSYDVSKMEKELAELKERLIKGKTASEEKLKKGKEQLYANIITKEKLDKLEATGISQEDAYLLLSLDISTIDMQQYQELLEYSIMLEAAIFSK